MRTPHRLPWAVFFVVVMSMLPAQEVPHAFVGARIEPCDGPAIASGSQ